MAKWYNIELDTYISKEFTRFLKRQCILFDTSQADILIHYNIYLTEAKKDLCTEWLNRNIEGKENDYILKAISLTHSKKDLLYILIPTASEFLTDFIRNEEITYFYLTNEEIEMLKNEGFKIW